MQQICNTRALPLEDPVASVIGPLTAHDDLLRHLVEIHFGRVRHLQPLCSSLRDDALPRARRRVAELPTCDQLETWYRTLQAALEGRADDGLSKRLVTLMMRALRGKAADEIAIAAFVIAIRDARLSPQLVAGAVRRSFTRFRIKPSALAFVRSCADHRAEVKDALTLVVRTMGLRRDAEKVAAGAGSCGWPLSARTPLQPGMGSS